jgi:hypothetical protein
MALPVASVFGTMKIAPLEGGKGNPPLDAVYETYGSMYHINAKLKRVIPSGLVSSKFRSA